MEDGAVGHNFEMGLHKDYSSQLGLIWFSGFREEDLNVIFYQNMPNLHNLYQIDWTKNSTEKLWLYVKLLRSKKNVCLLPHVKKI